MRDLLASSTIGPNANTSQNAISVDYMSSQNILEQLNEVMNDDGKDGRKKQDKTDSDSDS